MESPKVFGRLPSSALEPAACLAGECSGDVVRIRRNSAENGMEPRVVIEAAPKPADYPLTGQTGEGFVHGGA